MVFGVGCVGCWFGVWNLEFCVWVLFCVCNLVFVVLGFVFNKLVIFGVGLIGGLLVCVLCECVLGGVGEIVGVGCLCVLVECVLLFGVIDCVVVFDDDV